MGKSGQERVSNSLKGLREAIRVYHSEMKEKQQFGDQSVNPEPPEAWIRYKESKFWNQTLPWEGGLDDQPYILMLELSVCSVEESKIKSEAEEAAKRLGDLRNTLPKL